MQQGPNDTRQRRFEKYGEDRMPYDQGSVPSALPCPELAQEDPGAKPPLPLEILKTLCDQHNIPHSILTAAILAKSHDLTDPESTTKWLAEVNIYISCLSPIERLTPAISPLVSPWEFTSLSACLRRLEVLKDMRSAEGAEYSVAHLAAWWQLFKSFEGSDLKSHAAEIAAVLTYLVVPNEKPPKSNGTSELSGFVLRQRADTLKARFKPVNSNTAFPYRAKFIPGYHYLLYGKLAKIAPYLSDKEHGTGLIPLNKLLRIASSCGAKKLLSALRTHDPGTIKEAVLEAEAARAAAPLKDIKNRNLRRRAALTEEKRSALKERTAGEINKLETTLDNGCKSIKSVRISNETQSISALINKIRNEISAALESATEPPHGVDIEVPSALKRGANQLDLESFWHQAKQALAALKKALNPNTQESVEIGAEQPSSSPPQTEPSVEEILLVERAKTISAALANEIGTEVPFTVETDLRSNLVVVIAHLRPREIEKWSLRLAAINHKLPRLGDFELKIVPIAKHFSESSDDDRYIAANREQRPSIRISEVADAAEYLRDALKLNYPNAWAEVEHSGNTIVFRSQIKLSVPERDAIAKLMKLIPVPLLFKPPRQARPVTFT